MDWQIPLVVMAAVFGAFLVFKFRPAFSRPSRPGGATLREAKARIDAATTDDARAAALVDAADICALSLGRGTAAIGYYLRAMRLQPADPGIIERAAVGFVRRPRALEALLWRRLGAEPWTGATKAAAVAALRHLARLYSGPLRNAVRARALEHAHAALEAPSKS
ncbi:MAG: hypothetical protein ABIP89_21305 [Polyangiaceae bacterium]